MQHKGTGEFYPGEFGPEMAYEDLEYEDDCLYPGYCPDELNHQKNESEGEVDDWDRLMEISEVMNRMDFAGEGLGKQIVGSFAVLLDGEQTYGFEVHFWRLDDEPLPEGWEKTEV